MVCTVHGVGAQSALLTHRALLRTLSRPGSKKHRNDVVHGYTPRSDAPSHSDVEHIVVFAGDAQNLSETMQR